jgi:hypothetical protein
MSPILSYTGMSASSWFWLLPIAIVALATVVFVITYGPRTSGSLNDPYGSFHLALNEDYSSDKADGRDVNDRPRTEWLNMGFWKVC